MRTHHIHLLAALAFAATASAQKLSDLPAMTSGVDPANDILPIVDVSAGSGGTKKITPNNLFTGWGFTTAGKDLATAANTSAQRTTLGLVIGTNVQAWDSDLDNWASRSVPSGTVLGTSDAQTVTNKTLGGGTVFTSGPTMTLGSDGTGDIYYRNSGGVLTRLAAGTDGHVLTLASGLPSWAAPTGGGGGGGGDLLAANNLSELTNFATARTNLGLAIGTNVQAWDTDLDSWAAKTAPTGTVLGTSDTQTLTNKTLGSGTVFTSGPTMTLGSDATGDVYYRNSGGVLTRLAAGSNGQVLTLASGLPSWATASGSLANWTEAVNTSSPNATRPVVSFTATNAASDVDVVLAPKGNGATSSMIADGTTTGGNKRGTNAVDFQRARTAASQVASGQYSLIGSGVYNTASGDTCVVGGGRGNTNPGTYSGIFAGRDNTISSAWTSAFIGAGSNNSITADYGAVAGGQSNAAGDNAFIGGGQSNTAAGAYSVIPGGTGATTRGLRAVEARAGGNFASQGDAQIASYILRIQTTNNTTTELTLSGSGGSSSTRIIMPNSSAYKFTGQAVAREAATGDVKSWDITGTIERGANAASTAILGSVTVTVKDADAGASAWTLSVGADTSNGALQVQGTGETSKTIRWLVEIRTLEIG